MEEEKNWKEMRTSVQSTERIWKCFPLKKKSRNPNKYIPLMYSTMFILQTCFKSLSFFYFVFPFLLSLISLLVNLWFPWQLGSSKNVPSSSEADDLEPVVLKFAVTPWTSWDACWFSVRHGVYASEPVVRVYLMYELMPGWADAAPPDQ